MNELLEQSQEHRLRHRIAAVEEEAASMPPAPPLIA